MYLKTLNIEEFKDFQMHHPLGSLYQTINYGMFMAEDGYDYDLIGLVDENNQILAASLILLKPIGIKCFYGYAPRGFLIDYENTSLVQTFTTKLKEYYYEKDTIFIKVNPNLSIGEVTKPDYKTNYNSNYSTTSLLIKNDYKKLLDNLYFEAKLPRFNAIINLQEFDINNIHKNTRTKIRKGIRKGLKFIKASKNELNIFYELLKDTNHSEYYYQDLYTAFEKDNNIDLFLVSIDFNEFLNNSQYMYNIELEKNNKLNEKLANFYSERLINSKMNSDKVLLTYKNDIMEATKGINDHKEIYLAGALVIKNNKTVTIISSAFDRNYKRFAPNYFLHYNIIKYYQENYDYLDLNGVVGDFKKENEYTGLNRFKLSFNPHIYEYIGEFDLVIEKKSYNILLDNGVLAKEFNKK